MARGYFWSLPADAHAKKSQQGEDRCRWLEMNDGRFADVGRAALVTLRGYTRAATLSCDAMPMR